ncbi:MAG: sodium:proton antiporter [Pyrinomonadaceae bacterium]|nr:sodium:proton antiporter [Pyrinomonadaceae bacterium]
MKLFDTFSVLIVLSAAFAYINHRYFKLPSTIGLMFLSLLSSIVLIVVGILSPAFLDQATAALANFDFSDLLMGWMLSFLLFAGAIHVKLDELRKVLWSVTLFSTFGVVIATFVIGGAIYLILPLFRLDMQFLHCLLFGALIAPTDPIGVLGVLKEANVPKDLEMKITGEALFNDGVGVVVFLTILEAAQRPVPPTWLEVSTLFIQETIGGIVFGLAVGYLGFWLMRSIDNYAVEILITLAMVMGGYSLAHHLHISGPLSMVVAGLLVGNQGKKHAMSAVTEEYVDKFWELIDEILNALLFVIIGLELLVIKFTSSFVLIGLVAIFIVLGTRYVSIFLPAQIVRLKEKVENRTIVLLAWGGLRGGISIALALSLKPETGKDLWVALTYFVVAFSILVQGLTVGRLAKRLVANSTSTTS